MENSKQPIKVEITQDKLVDILLHAATREDLAKLAAETKNEMQKLDNKIDNLEAKFDSRMDKFDSRMDKFDSRMDKFDSRIDRLDIKIDRLMWLMIAGILIPIAMHLFLK